MLNMYKIRIKNVFISIYMVMFLYRRKGIGGYVLIFIIVDGNYLFKFLGFSVLR